MALMGLSGFDGMVFVWFFWEERRGGRQTYRQLMVWTLALAG